MHDCSNRSNCGEASQAATKPVKPKAKRARRGRGEGSISQRKRDGRVEWYARLSLGYNGSGKRIRKVVYGETKQEVAEKLRKLQAANDAGRLIETDQLTVGEYLTQWLNNTAKNKVRPQTWERYRQLVELHLIPILGAMKLAKLAPLHVEQCYATMEKGHGDRKPAGAWTRKMAGVLLSNALRHAVRMKLVAYNAAADVVKARPAEREIRFLTQSQDRRLLAAAKSHRLYALFATAIGTGARQGELFGLQWGDIDFDAGTLSIRRSLGWVKQEPHLKEPKSKSSRRVIRLPAFVLQALREHLKAAMADGLAAAPVFCTKTGTHIYKSNFLRQIFRPIVKRANAAERKRAEETNTQADLIPEAVRFHDLRHTHASQLVAAGHSIKAVSQRLGHASIEITLRVYAHLMPNDDEKLAAGAEVLFA
jgi:integrase